MKGNKRFRSIPDNPVIHEKELEESFYFKTIDALPYPLLVLKPDYTVSMSNRAARKLYSNNNSGTKLCYQLVYGRTTPCGEEEPCPLDIVRTTGKPLVMEKIYRDERGIETPVEICALPVVDQNGRLVRVIETVLDITERKRAGELHRRYELLSENARDIILFVGMDGKIIEANRAAVESYGYSRDELLQMSILDLRSPETRAQVDSQMQQAYSKGILFETMHRRSDGTDFPVEVSSQRIRVGSEQMLLSIIRDISERKQAEESIMAAHRQMMDIIEFLPDATLAVDRDRKVIAWNRAMEEMTGIPKEQIIGQGDFSYAVPFYGVKKPVLLDLLWADSETVEEHYLNVSRNGDVLYAETFAPLMNNGRGMHLWLKASPLYDGNGNIVGAIESIRDVTGFKQAQEALSWEAEANAALAQLSNALASSDSISDQSALVLEHGKRLTGSQFGFVGYIDQQTGHLLSPTMSRDVWDLCQVPDKNIVFEKFNGLYGWVLENKKTLLTNEPAADSRSVGVPEGHIPINRFLSAPALLGNRLLGVVALANSNRDYNDRDREVVERLASLFALAIRRKQEEERMSKINDCFLGFSSNPNENINLLTALCGELMGASSAVYNRLDRDMLCSTGQWRTPPEYKPNDHPDGHICYDLISRGGDEIMVVRNLQTTNYAVTDPNVAAFGLQTYVGHPVKLGDKCVGALCVVYQRDYIPSRDDRRIMGIIASAIRVEEERKQALIRLRESREFNLAVLNSLTAHIAVLDDNGCIVAVNKAWKEFGRENGANPVTLSTSGINYLETCRRSVESGDAHAREALQGITAVLNGEQPQFSMEYPCHSPCGKRWFMLHVTPMPGRVGGAVVSHLEITDQKKNEERQEAELAMLAELTNFTNLKPALYNVLSILTRVTGCQAAAIRLADGDDFTYYTHNGFPEHFIAMESSLCTMAQDGPMKDASGNVKLECLCGKVLQERLAGRIEDKYITPYGSFITGSASSIGDDPRGPLKLEGPWRLTCIDSGYQTIVLVPIKDEGENIGLLQLNGTHQNQVTKEDMPFLELVSRYIASAVRHMKDSEALQESEERYRRLAENAPDVIYRINLVPELRFEYISPAVEKMTGYTPEEHYANPELGFNVIHPEDRHLMEEIIGARADFPEPLELRWIGKDGRVVWTEQRNLLIRDRDGQVVALEGIARDITERKKVEYAKHKQVQNDRAMTEAMAIFTGNHNRNDVLEKLLDLLAQRLEYNTGAYYAYDEWSRSLNLVVTRNADEVRLARLLKLGPNRIGDIIMRKRVRLIRGSEAGLLPAPEAGEQNQDTVTAVLPVFYQDQLQGVLLLGATRETDPNDMDFLERVSVQLGISLHGIKQFEYLKTLSQQLAARQKEIEKKNRELEQANRAKSEFLTNMSHELRTPLNSVIGFSELLEKQIFGELNERQLEYVKDIRESGEHLLALINDILDLSKIEAGSMELDLNEFNLPDLLHGCLRLLREKAMKKNVTLDLDVDERIGLVVADSRKIKQVIFNLLANAVKFTPAGGEVLLSAVTDESSVTISVKDNGIGISEADMDKLFQEFSQVDGSLSRRHEGTGLGLALSKKLVEMHGGSIGVESSPGQGSRFYFTFPVQPVPATPNGIAIPSAPPRREKEEMTEESPLILVVEDNDLDAKLMKTHLLNEGFRVARAANGQQGFEMAKKLRPQVISLDILMPVMDGWELLERLQKDPELKNIPVIVVSVLADSPGGGKFGASELLLKPFDPESMVEIVHRLARFNPHIKSSSTILVIDDDPRAVELLEQSLLSQGYRVLKAYGGTEGIKIAREENVDLIMLDLMMPEFNGFDVVNTLKNDPRLKHVPVIIITAKILTTRDYQKLQGLVETVREKGNYSQDSLLAEVSRVLHRQRCGKE